MTGTLEDETIQQAIKTRISRLRPCPADVGWMGSIVFNRTRTVLSRINARMRHTGHRMR